MSLYLVYVLWELRTVVSSDFVDSAMGPALSLELVLVSVLIIAVSGAAMGYLTMIARRTVAQGVRLEVANALLGRYFSPSVVARVSSEADTLLGVGGRTQEVAVMFCDIRDFATITEKMPPSDVVEFLSQYHTRMVEVIFAFGDTIDKFIGDAIVVKVVSIVPGLARGGSRPFPARLAALSSRHGQLRQGTVEQEDTGHGATL